MRDVPGSRLIMMVAQQPFAANDNRFCNLVPICYTDDSERARADDFPNDGQVWWMLRGHTEKLARPGDLVVGIIEESKDSDSTDPTKSHYQVQRDSVEPVDPRYGFEVIDVPAAAISDISDLAEDTFRMPSYGRAMRRVALRWRGNVYVPFRATFDVEYGKEEGTLTFVPESPEGEIYGFTEQEFAAATKTNRLIMEEDVSMEPQRRSVAFNRLRTVRKEIVVGPVWEKLITNAQQRITLESLKHKLHRYAKDCLSRKNKQEFNKYLALMEEGAKEKANAEEIISQIARYRGSLASIEDALAAVADALLRADMLGEGRLQEAIDKHADLWVQKQSATLQSRIETSLAERRAELRQIEDEITGATVCRETEEAYKRREFEQQLEEERIKHQREFEKEHDRLEQDKVALASQREILKSSLERVTHELRTAGQDVVNKYLTIRPLLGLGDADVRPSGAEPASAPARLAPVAMQPMDIPLWAGRPEIGELPELTERDFFDRFQDYVEKRGYAYRRLDLVRFHLSVKLGELTVLGGPSGTGKSSLPMLYATALRGEATDRPQCLMIGVNPSWMDPRDLLGYLSAMDGEFHPSESGLFKHLVVAQEEYKNARDAAGVSVVCLDEMNLSQVEHYFSDFMMVLERPDEFREIQCFDAMAASPQSVFLPYSRVRVAHSVAFVGTVNFDESTRVLSDRLLDRINLIRLSHEGLPTPGAPAASAAVQGRHVTATDFRRWTQEPNLPPEQATLLDNIRPILRDLGVPVSPRVYRATARYVSSASEFLSPAAAFDLQFAQRIVPKIRGVMSERRREALDKLMRTLEMATPPFDESLALLDEVRSLASPRQWMDEE